MVCHYAARVRGGDSQNLPACVGRRPSSAEALLTLGAARRTRPASGA